MVPDYSEYRLSRRELIQFLLAGYLCLFLVFFLFFHSLILSAAAGALIRLALPAYRSHLAEKRRRKLNEQFKDLLYSLSASITAGRQMEEALIEAEENLTAMYPAHAPIIRELKHMKRGIVENNESDRVLLADFARRSGCEDINSFVQVYLTCRSMGGDIERIISHTVNIMTDKIEISAQIAVLTAQKKLEGRIISLMPLAMLGALNLLSPAYIDVLYTTAAGRLIMGICLAATLAGIRMMEKLTDVEC